MSAPFISIYTNKGGTSKTTNTVHLAWALAKFNNKKVLLIDADPQCNLTQVLIPESRKDPDFFDKRSHQDIFSALSPIFYGQTKTPKASECLMVRPEVFTSRGSSAGMLFLLPGSLRLSTLEPTVALAHSLATSPSYPIFDGVPGAIRAVFELTAASLKVDIVFIDMGPSIGELNQSIFYATDYFILPMAADVFSKSTIATMQATMASWAWQHSLLSKATAEKPLPVKNSMPKFLGCVISMFNVAGKEGKPVKHAQVWIDLIKASIQKSFVPHMIKNDMVHNVQAEGYCLAEVPHFLSLLQISQRASFPVFDIPDERYETWDEKKGEIRKMTSSEREPQKNRAEVFKRIYCELADLVERQVLSN